mmetsp:Transcript_20466/g.36797  ORF Transcript_20466/g.36797 Transcript_20466/m.36797 type:complete len:214 (-) Transcript_20466:150-791(-)
MTPHLPHQIIPKKHNLLRKKTHPTRITREYGMLHPRSQRRRDEIRYGSAGQHSRNSRIVGPRYEYESTLFRDIRKFANDIGQIVKVTRCGLGSFGFGGEVAHEDEDGEGRKFGVSREHAFDFVEYRGAVEVDVGEDDEHALATVFDFLGGEFFEFGEGADGVEDVGVLQAHGFYGVGSIFDNGTPHVMNMQNTIHRFPLHQNDTILGNETIRQ